MRNGRLKNLDRTSGRDDGSRRELHPLHDARASCPQATSSCLSLRSKMANAIWISGTQSIGRALPGCCKRRRNGTSPCRSSCSTSTSMPAGSSGTIVRPGTWTTTSTTHAQSRDLHVFRSLAEFGAREHLRNTLGKPAVLAQPSQLSPSPHQSHEDLWKRRVGIGGRGRTPWRFATRLVRESGMSSMSTPPGRWPGSRRSHWGSGRSWRVCTGCGRYPNLDS